ncbi:MAG: uL15 family ribosomal protein [bacterium]|nr:uL15 family ribosomal protein [bacterium]
MQLHEIRPSHKKKKAKRVGRGGKRGTYSGKGIKGQKARAGRRFQPFVRQLVKKYHKLRGSRSQRSVHPYVTISLDALEKHCKTGETITPQLLIERRIARRMEGKIPMIKILDRGELTKAFTVESCFVSKGAKEKIEKAGGKVVFL